MKGAKRAGLIYERKAQKVLLERYGDALLPALWLRFLNNPNSCWRYCSPDALIFDLQQLHITLVEIKLKHTVQAWWQLRQLYEPVVRRLFGEDFSYSCCEVVKWFDPHTSFPEHFTLSDRVHEKSMQGKFLVHILNKR